MGGRDSRSDMRPINIQRPRLIRTPIRALRSFLEDTQHPLLLSCHPPRPFLTCVEWVRLLLESARVVSSSPTAAFTKLFGARLGAIESTAYSESEGWAASFVS